jgi:anion-transporting  ArsA/GET3 family ATPase
MDLASVLDSHRVVVCVGSGGVGKTTTSAALSVRAAMQGRRVLCLTIDPAKRLAQSLGLSQLRGSEQIVPKDLFAEHGLLCKGTLSAMMLDMKHTFDELVERTASSPEQRDRILGNRIYQYVSTSLAGTQEYMAMEKLHAVRRDARYDLVVLDTPPTTNALDFLDAPQKLVGAIDSPVMRWFVETLEGSRSLGLVGRSTAFVLKGLSRFTGVEFLEQVGQFVGELNVLFGGFRERARAVYDDLKSADVAFVIVTSPAPLTVAEAVYFTRKLRDYGIEPKAMVVNRVHEPPAPGPAQDTAIAELTQLLRAQGSNEDARALWTLMDAALRDDRALSHRDQEGVRRLHESIGGALPFIVVPAFERDVHDLGALAQLSEHFAVG